MIVAILVGFSWLSQVFKNNFNQDEVFMPLNQEQQAKGLNLLQDTIDQGEYFSIIENARKKGEITPDQAVMIYRAMSGVALTSVELEKLRTIQVTDDTNEKVGVLDDVVLPVRAIMMHPCPQNRRSGDDGYTFQIRRGDIGPQANEDLVNNPNDVFWHEPGNMGIPQHEPRGILGLTAHAAKRVTRDDVVDYMLGELNKKIQAAKPGEHQILSSEVMKDNELLSAEGDKKNNILLRADNVPCPTPTAAATEQRPVAASVPTRPGSAQGTPRTSVSAPTPRHYFDKTPVDSFSPVPMFRVQVNPLAEILATLMFCRMLQLAALVIVFSKVSNKLYTGPAVAYHKGINIQRPEEESPAPRFTLVR